MRTLAVVVISLTTATSAAAQEGWVVDEISDEVLVLRDEVGSWSDNYKLRIAHINTTQYWVRKTLDLAALPEGALDRADHARLRMYIGLQDWSWHEPDIEDNGLNAQFEIAVNDTALQFDTSDPRFPGRAKQDEPLKWEWVDVDLPLDCLQPGENTVVIRKLPGNTDDYIYPAIDNTVDYDHSATSYDGGETWEQGLNANDAQGEFMIRFVLIAGEMQRAATWTPADSDDPGGFIAWAGEVDGALIIEPDQDAYDAGSSVTATVRYDGDVPEVTWLDMHDRPLGAEMTRQDDALVTEFPASAVVPGSLRVTPADAVREVHVAHTRSVQPPRPTIDMAPEIAEPTGQRHEVGAPCTVEDGRATIETPGLRVVFSTEPTLALQSLHVAEIDRNVLARPEATHLFRIKVGDEVYGCRDCEVREVEEALNGVRVELDVAETGLAAQLLAWAQDDELKLGLTVENRGHEPIDFYTTFPHLDGIELSEDPSGDYYLFPLWGGVIADVHAQLRDCYGNNTAWWQMIDLFSPERGGGLYVRSDDPTGLLKYFALRKGLVAGPGYTVDQTMTRMRADMTWLGSLESDPGIGVALDYVRRTRAPGESFEAPAAAVGSHAGDWRPALEHYVRWASDTWGTRPYPSELTHRWYIDPTGWSGQLVNEDGFTLDAVRENVDIAELMSWWAWGELGPWNTPLDEVKEQCGEKFHNFRKSSFLMEPVTGQLRYTKNRGDYEYFEPWGGAPALRAYTDRVREMGVMPTFYIEGILACATTDVAKQHARDQAVIAPDWANPQSQHWCPKVPDGYVGQWGSYQMCSDAEFWPEYLAKTVARVCRDTGIDGVRLDEYGHRGWVCHNDRHEHIFAEPGHNAWLQATERSCRLVHEKMDEVREGLCLMTEFPGHDHLASTLEAALSHESNPRHAPAVRPVPCDLFRCYFRHCKMFELGRPETPEQRAWNVFNAHATFGGSARHSADVFHTLVENTDAFEGKTVTPLVDTLVPLVYANRFEGDGARNAGGKTIWTFFNATGHTVEEPLLSVEPGADHHYVNLLTGEEIAPVATDDVPALSFRLRRDCAAVIARLPRELGIDGGRVTGDGEIVIVADKGARLATANSGDTLPQITEGEPHMIKLLRDGRLVDALAWP